MSAERLNKQELVDKQLETKSKKELDNNNNRSEEDDDDDDDDIPRLSEHTLKALQEFYVEAEAQEKSLDENWQLSQFWYDKKTSETLSKEVLTTAVNELKSSKSTFNIACISCPTLFKSLHVYLKEARAHEDIPDLAEYLNHIDIKLFEYDKRFEIYGEDFVFYDYNNPLGYDAKFNSHFDMIISDPPYLADECHIKTGMTVRKIGTEKHRLLICTGAVMEDLLAASLKVKLVSFVPRHERNLANEFKCYANYETLFLNS